MNEYIEHVQEELKRVDHLIYVSLKYTRTVDVIRSIIVRIINAYDFMMDAVIYDLKQKGVVQAMPQLPGLKCELLKKHFADQKNIVDCLDFYLMLRKIMRSKYKSGQEFRRHVTMTVDVIDIDTGEKKAIEVNMDVVKEYYEKTKLCFEEVLRYLNV